METKDRKLLVREDAAADVAAAFEAGKILPFAALFPQTEPVTVTESNKRGRSVVQISFLIRDGNGRILVTRRAAHSAATPHGHGTTTGASVVVSWSPVTPPPGRPWPMSEEDILFAYRMEVAEKPGPDGALPRPEFRWLGLARSFAGQDVTYYLYAFEAAYPGEPVIEHLRKDRDDEASGFVEPTTALLDAVGKKKGDLQILRAAGIDIGDRDLGQSGFVAATPGEPPPYLLQTPWCFVSHACSDHHSVRELVGRLEIAGIPCWMDKRDIVPGREWEPGFLDALACARSFLLVVTKASGAKPNVAEEVLRARARRDRQPTFPFVAVALEGESSVTDHLPPTFPRTRQVADFRTPEEVEAAWPKVVAELRSALFPADRPIASPDAQRAPASEDFQAPGLSPEEKGRRYEAYISRVLEARFHVVDRDLRTDVGELDLIVSVRDADPFWADYGSDILVECKNWNDHAPLRETALFAQKAFQARCRLGLFISESGFTKDALQQLRLNAANHLSPVIVPIDGADLRQALARKELLDDYLKRAIRRARFQSR